MRLPILGKNNIECSVLPCYRYRGQQRKNGQRQGKPPSCCPLAQTDIQENEVAQSLRLALLHMLIRQGLTCDLIETHNSYPYETSIF